MFKALQERSQLVMRLQQIVAVFARHGFYGVVKRLSLHRQLSPLDRFRYARLHQEEDKHTAVRLRQAFEELGPTFIKFGQLLSARHDLIPETFARELRRLFWHTRAGTLGGDQEGATGLLCGPRFTFQHDPSGALGVRQRRPDPPGDT